MMGHQFGPPFHTKAQRRIITEALNLLQTATESPTIEDLPLTWSEVRKESRLIEQDRQ